MGGKYHVRELTIGHLEPPLLLEPLEHREIPRA